MFVKAPVPKFLPVIGTTEASSSTLSKDADGPLLAADPTTVGWGPLPERRSSLVLTPEERRLFIVE